jgi:ubiquinone/menaquinone biosynthesis C-methylase UbiE
MTVMSQLVFDEDAARRIESLYRIGEAQRRRETVRETLGARPGERVLDVGCGPGFYCAELAAEVGPSGSVVGVDSSEAMLALATRRCAELPQVALRVADATALGVADADFDAAICVQVLEYLAEPRDGLAELYRALRPGGRVLVWDIDWATLSMQDDELTRRVHRAWDEHLAHRSLPRTLAPSLRAAGFERVRAQAHPLASIAVDPETYGGALLPFIAAFVGGRAGVSVEETEAWLEAQRALDERGEYYFAVTQFCFTALKPS